MRNFCHISDFEEHGYQLVPSMLMMSEKLVLWGPAPDEIKLYNATHNTLLTPKDFLELIESNQISIIAREEWLTSKTYRNNHPWPQAKWDDTFDGEIKRWAYEDRDKALEDRRVIVAKKEPGYDSADQFLADSANKDKVEKLQNRMATLKLPRGMVGKLQREKHDHDKLRVVVRDMYNHVDARANAHAQQSVEPDEWMGIIYEILDIETEQWNYEVSAEKFWEALEFLKEHHSARNFKDLQKILNHKAKITADLTKLYKSSDSIKAVLEESIAKGMKPPSWAEVFRKSTRDVVTVGSLLSIVASFLFAPPQTAMVLITGLTTAALGPLAQNAGIKTSILRREMDGFALPYIIAYGTDKGTYEEARRLFELYTDKDLSK
ncbi:MAG: hypothetical protein ACOYXT_15555 [Bacteroidota bacterium]